MQYSFKYIITLITVCLIVIDVDGQTSYVDIESYIFNGNLEKADSITNFQLQKSQQHEIKANLFQLKGDILKLSGDIDGAFTHWIESNKQRNLAYPKDDYHQAWNYALLSNYHYEKINRDLAKTYADSCLALIQNLTIDKQKELEIYKIWNILGQSIKQQANDSDLKKYNQIYLECFSLYQKSVDFQLKYNTSKHHLAKTYHLIGNAHLDQIYVYNHVNELKKANWSQQQSVTYHNKAISIWNNLYGKQHYELGRTLFIKGLLHSYLSIWKTEHKIEAVELFRKAMNAYGINPSNFGLTQLNPIPNKEDVLMCMKYYTLGLLELDLLNSINNSYLLEAKKVNAAAIKVWEQIHYSFKGKNINQNLAIYNLIPQQEQLAILMRKKKSESDDVKEIFLQANEKLKYYDLFKGKQLSKNRTTTMEGIQKNLRSNQLLMDFHFSPSNQEIYVLQITKDKSKIIIVNGNILKTATEFKAAIVDMNYEGYIKTAYELYNKLFPSGLKNINELIICPDAFFGDFPFEALLCSTNNIEQKDYRKLDYLMNKTAVQYVLTPSMFTNKEHKTEWRLSVFAPSFNTDKFAELPFSQKMGKSLVEELSAISYNGTKATKKALQHIKSSIVHLSTHAVIGDDATNNFIQLTNGAFYQNEINGLNHIPNLVVLNACNSGKGKQLIGDGINGFVRELHKTGVNATLSNLWEVDDKISNELLLLFYKELYAEKNATYALRYAKLNTINSAANSNLAAPYYWAGHQLIGGELVFEVESEKEDKIVLYWLLLLFAFITGIWFFLSNKKYS